MKIVPSSWFPRERTFFENGFEERDLERGGLVVGICRVWVYHGIMWKGVEDFFFDLVSYFEYNSLSSISPPFVSNPNSFLSVYFLLNKIRSFLGK